MTATPDIAVIIPNWNGQHVLEDCLEGVASAGKETAFEVIVYDNGSTDRSPEILETWARRLPLCVVAGDENVGFAEACNRGYLQSSAGLILFLNNDAVLQGKLYDAVRYMASRPEIGIAQGPLLTRDGTEIDSVGGLMTRSGFLTHPLQFARLGVSLPPSRDVFSVKGAAMFVRRVVIESVGLFPEDAFAYFEETDLCWRARMAGWRVRYSSSLPVALHVGGHSAHRLPTSVSEFHSFKNRLRSILVNAGGSTLAYMLPLHMGICACAACAAIASGRLRGAGAVVGAYVWNVRSLRDTYRRRRCVQRARVVPDAMVFASVTEPIHIREFLRTGLSYQSAKRRPRQDMRLLSTKARRAHMDLAPGDRDLEWLASDWDELAEMDPLWAVLSEGDFRGGRWDPREFYATGEREVAYVLDRSSALGRPSARVRALDFGCGVGRLTRALADHFDEVTGVDISPRMVELAARPDESAGLSFIVNQRPDLSIFRDATFDFVMTGRVLQHLPTTSLARGYIAEMIRVTRPDGLLYFQLPHRLHASYRILGRHRPFIVLRRLGVNPRWMQARLGLHPMRMLAMSEAEVKALVSASGGIVLDVEPHPHEGRRYFVTRRPPS